MIKLGFFVCRFLDLGFQVLVIGVLFEGLSFRVIGFYNFEYIT